MINAKTLLAVCTLSPVFAQTTVTYSYNGLPLPIYTDSSNVITIANIFVPRSLQMTKVTAQVQISYPNSGDLNVYLFSPQGTRTILLQHDCSVVNVDTTFDDAAQSAWKSFCPTEAGRGPFQPDQPLANFNSDGSSFGTWSLTVNNDQSQSRSGWITGFSLTITGNPLTAPAIRSTTVTNAANVRANMGIAPGQLISVYGVALGPDTAVTAPSGNLPTSLGGSSVLINGAAAPIAYASMYRLDVQAPFTLSPGSTATIQVSANGQTSTGQTVNVVTANPAIYTRSVDGAGQVMATNADGSANSTASPAPKGSTIVVFGSGLGTVSPAVAAGTAPPNSPLSTVSGVTATIGGVSAPVQFAGLAPGMPGLYQLNIQVPSGASSGAQQLIITASGQTSQNGALIQVQ